MIGTVVLVAEAKSLNYGTRNITYSMTYRTGGPDFGIDPTTGVVMTSNTLNYLRDRIYVVCFTEFSMSVSVMYC